jgi:predicted nucleic acid-binding protein
MILVDTSVWIDHLRATETGLVAALNAEQVLMHPFVVGELACGNLKNRQEILSLLRNLPSAPIATQDQVLELIDRHRLMGLGIGFIDAHLLTATTLASPARIWTRDKRLAIVAGGLNLTLQPETH